VLYCDFPKYAIWDAKNKSWKRRKNQRKTLGRIYFCSPTDTERYCLRVLLHHVAGCRSFQELRTVNNVEYQTFKEAVIARGLMEDDKEMQRCMDEAIVSASPKQLRQLFCTLLLFNEPNNIELLWSTYKSHLMEDFAHLNSPVQSVMIEFENLLSPSGKHVSDYPGLPQDVDLSNYDEYSSLQKFSNLEQMAQEVILLENTLNADQKLFYNAICDLLDGKVATTNINSNFFLDGPGDLNLT